MFNNNLKKLWNMMVTVELVHFKCLKKKMDELEIKGKM